MIRRIFDRKIHRQAGIVRGLTIACAFVSSLVISLAISLVIVISSPVSVMAYDNVVVVIDPGHGGIVSADNSNGGCMYNNLCEKDVNLITATALYNELSQYKNVTVYMTRQVDVETSIEQRVQFAKGVDADVLVSVHYNASNDHIFYGSEIFTSMYGQQRATGYGLAGCIMKKWDEFGSASKGIKTRKGNNGDYYGLIRQGKELGIPVIILEHGYLDNDNDFARMGTAEKWQELGVLDATGIAEYYGLKKDLVQGSITPTVKVQSYSAPAFPDDTPPASVKLVVDEYDVEAGVIKYSVSASEDADDLMYFGVMKGPITSESIFTDLKLWDNSKGVQTGEITVPAEYSGHLTARVYNAYELYTDSEPVDLEKVIDDIKKNGSKNGDLIDEKTGEGGMGSEAEKSDGEALGEASEDSDGLEVIDTIIVNSAASDPVEITPEMVDEAQNTVSLANKAKIGLAVALSLVGLALVICVALGIHKLIYNIKKDRKNGHRRYDWEDDNDY